MEPTEPNHRRGHSTPQSIPLQDLTRPPGSLPRRRTLSERGRDLIRNREGWARPYEAIAERDPSPVRPSLRVVTPNSSLQTPPQYNVGDASPLEDVAGFQEAMGFAGLSFQGETSRPSPDRNPSFPSFVTLDRADSESTNDQDDRQEFSPPGETDTIPLTTPHRSIKHTAGPSLSAPGGQRHDRLSGHSVKFAPMERTSHSGGMLGDDLGMAEAGLRPSSDDIRRSASLKRTLSPMAAGNTLHRAGTIVRQMSQRIVNVSNEPADAVVERGIRRKSSVKQRPELHRLPSVQEYSVDGTPYQEEPGEKQPPTVDEERVVEEPKIVTNPMKGKSLGIFAPDSRVRQFCCNILLHPLTELFILFLIFLQAILLTIDAATDVFNNPNSRLWGHSWIDFALLGLFIVYTVEMVIRIIVSGLIINPREYSTINRSIGFRKAIALKLNTLFSLEHEPPRGTNSSFDPEQPSHFDSFTSAPPQAPILDFSGSSRDRQRARLAYRAYLRHSFNRIDFLAIVSYWISFILQISGLEHSTHAYVFRMLACLRIIRLLALTTGTGVILRSLKKAAPMLVNVALLIGFFWLLFAIVGMQAFKSSLRRTCVWIDPDEKQPDYPVPFQFCGGWIAPNGTVMPWLLPDGKHGATRHKGYTCPLNSRCIQGDNPYNGTVSFDNILQSLQLVFVVMSSNTFSDLLYYLTDSDYLAAALFFAAGIVIMFFWLVNLLIAVITSSFQVIREESKASAFTGEERDPMLDEDPHNDTVTTRRKNKLKKLYQKFSWVWIVIIVFDLVIAALRSASMTHQREQLINTVETVVTIILFVEIVIRFVVEGGPRNFFRSRRNIADAILAIVTMVIQIPNIHNSGQPYAWLTIFQIARIYRVVLAVPLTRDLVLIVLGNMSGIINLIYFVFLLNWIGAIFASQLFRGELPTVDSQGNQLTVTFFTIWNSFIGMYQIFSSENWTTIMYSVTAAEVHFKTAWIGATFFILWFILANFIVLNMFIAVIQESFDVSEDEKRLQQVKAFLQDKDLGGTSHGNLSLSTIFKFSLATGRRRDPLAFSNATTELLLKDAIVKDFLDQQEEPIEMVASPPPEDEQPILRSAPTKVVQAGLLSTLWGRFVNFFKDKEPNPFYSSLEFSKAYEELEPTQMAREVVSARDRRKKAQREYLRKHPSYNVSLFIFKPHNPIRKLCQRIVGPGRGGDRIEGVAPSVPVWYGFSFFIYCAIVAMVLLACITTPVYQKQYFSAPGRDFTPKNWFVFTDLGFAILFTIEAIIKVIADGFFWTPNAYFRGVWGFIDGIVLITLWINVGTALFNEGQVSRAVGAFKALRALRLLNVSDSARNTFHSVIVQGGIKVLSAAFVSLSLLIPFAIYGLNIFHGRLQQCNDGNSGIFDLNDCTGEYMNQPFNWNVLSPRVASNPYYDFDDFGGSLFILFQIVSQEGWIDVMNAAQSITGVFTQPNLFADQFNAVFFIVFNLLGAVFVLTLFVSVFMRNYTEQTGVAFLTADQRSWLELRKLLRQISPSKRPIPTKKRETWKEWCYRRAVRKTGRWQRFMTMALIFHLILLCADTYPSPVWWDRLRVSIFFVLTLLYIANIFIRIIGLSWTRFRKSSWDFYSIFAVGGTFISSILLFTNFDNAIYVQIHNVFLVLVALMLIPRNNQLDQLFKTAAASLPWIANLLATWFVLFLVYAIALTQTFGLTRFGPDQSDNVNFRSVPKALILLFRISVGEGWNQLMEDFAIIEPPFCHDDDDVFLNSDCGSTDWARALFITWNILSMYIFVNLFVSLIYESFSYVYQRSSGLSVISREETRRFKQAWAEFDPEGTGFIPKEAFPRLLGELSGVWEMRVYDGDWTVARLIEDCSKPDRVSAIPVEGQITSREIDLKKLNARLRELPVAEIRKRRARMNKFYEEVLVSSDPERGINFTAVLMILAHYKVINDNKSLRLKEFLRRRARLQRVDEAVRRNIVRGFFDTVYWSRRFRQSKEKKNAGRMTDVPQFTVPEIYVDDEPPSAGPSNYMSNPFLSPPLHSPGRYDSDESERTGFDGAITPAASDASSRSRANSIQVTPNQSPTREHPPRPILHHASRSDVSTGGEWLSAAGSRPVSPLHGGPGDGPGRSRANSSVSAQDVMEVLDNSAWGESIRRSFTMRRPARDRSR
ncbi:calcium channel-like protein subunit Cch1 [Rhizodiscina lignyota]|uniref:Calcium-channel protein CCH1 n=1 Tax=Rhizodiscina lignyota TaxID=1504668 RepID=A0A9P4M2P7_9PEZI|nr:calcium channel-like protein subunit Cch1 [Rhizodiscina lignyota]